MISYATLPIGHWNNYLIGLSNLIGTICLGITLIFALTVIIYIVAKIKEHINKTEYCRLKRNVKIIGLSSIILFIALNIYRDLMFDHFFGYRSEQEAISAGAMTLSFNRGLITVIFSLAILVISFIVLLFTRKNKYEEKNKRVINAINIVFASLMNASIVMWLISLLLLNVFK